MGKPILFVVNPISGDQDKEVLIQKIENWSSNQGYSAHIFKTKGQKDTESIQDLIEETRTDLVVAVGGDGTVKLCATILKDTDLQLGIIPAGSANGMATDLRIPKNILEALDLLTNGKTKKIDLLQFNGEELGLHISDIGLNAGLVQKFEESEYRGFLGYASGVFNEVQDFSEFEVEIKADGNGVESYTTFMVAIANAKRYGTGALLNTVGEIDDGILEICVFENLDFINITRHFLEQITKNDSHYRVIQCSEASISIPGRKKPFQIDGEYKGEIEEVYVKILPQCLHLRVPH